ncbi:MAG: nuclear transport factor 2 family protein [Candidatus Binatia bacterium]
MDTLQQFMAYAGDFERTYADDDWSRLRAHFADDAIYDVRGSFGCTLVGPTAIFTGMKKSLDNFDRRFTARDIAVTSGPEVDGAELRVGWQVTYTKEGLPPFVLRGRSTVRCANGVIVYLSDSFEPEVAGELADWQRRTGVAIDPSYA